MNREQSTLLQAFGNSYDDLSANRLGQLSAAQQRKLLSNSKWSLALTCIGLFLVTLPFYLFQWVGGILLFLLLLAICIIINIKHMRQIRAAAANGRVETLLGQIELEKSGSELAGGWFFIAADQSFQLPIFHPWHNYNDPTYRGYIMPGIHRIVAIEPVYEMPWAKSNAG
jgi:hypothetical protein